MNKLSDLKPDQKNARKHNPRNIGMVANSLREVGAARSGVIDEKGNILAGNGTYEALSEAGIEKVKIVQADGNEWVVVQRKGLSEKQKLKLALYDNRSAELAEWDKEVLADIDPEIMESMFSTDELEDLLDDVGGSEELDGEDDVPEAPEKAISQLGDLYQLGQHRLLCGDSTAKDAVDKLMDGQKADICFTSPPYNAGSTPKEKSKYKNDSDDRSQDEYRIFLNDFTTIALTVCDFVFSNIQMLSGNKIALLSHLYEMKENLADVMVWHKGKGQPAMAEQVLNSAYENIYIFSHAGNRSIGTKSFRGTIPNIFELNRGHNEYSGVHNAVYSVELPEMFITWFSEGSVYEPFGGTGTNMIACEKLNRKCYMMELDPQYCDVIVKRFNGLFPEIEILRNGKEFEPIHE